MQAWAIGRTAVIIAGLLAHCGGAAVAGGTDDRVQAPVAQVISESGAAASLSKRTKANRSPQRGKRISSRNHSHKPNASEDANSAVADANARMTSPLPQEGAVQVPASVTPDTPADPTTIQNLAQAAPASRDTDASILASDQLNELDRAASDEKAPYRVLRPVTSVPYIANTSAEDAWGQTSLVGKVFVAVGAFLMLASAARMFIA